MKTQSAWISVTLFTFVLLAAGCGLPPPPTEPAATQYEYTFEKFPDGTPIQGDTAAPVGTPVPWDGTQSLRGDEFSAWGFQVGPNSNPSCAIVRIGYYKSKQHYLAIPDDSPCPDRKLWIEFEAPVQKVALDFTGASLGYYLTAFDAEGGKLDESMVKGEFDEEGKLFTINVDSNTTNIKRVRFGLDQTAVVAVQKITYWR